MNAYEFNHLWWEVNAVRIFLVIAAVVALLLWCLANMMNGDDQGKHQQGDIFAGGAGHEEEAQASE